jgi:hypothetical protein
VLLAFAVARLFPDGLSNALEPGWVLTKMGGPDAPDDFHVISLLEDFCRRPYSAAIPTGK